MRVCVLLFLLAPLTARGVCVMGPMLFVVDVELRSCTTREAFVATTRECLPPWMNDWHRRIMERDRGVIVEGTIHRQMEVTWYDGKSATLGASVSVVQDGKWSLKAETKLDCETIKPGALVRLALFKRCCDVIPPSDFSCWYGLDTLGPLPEPVTKALQGR